MYGGVGDMNSALGGLGSPLMPYPQRLGGQQGYATAPNPYGIPYQTGLHGTPYVLPNGQLGIHGGGQMFAPSYGAAGGGADGSGLAGQLSSLSLGADSVAAHGHNPNTTMHYQMNANPYAHQMYPQYIPAMAYQHSLQVEERRVRGEQI